MQKAFDTVNRDCLMYKLANIGICGPMYKAIKSLYDNVLCSVRVNGAHTEWFDVELGVKQGCILSPTLFSIFINDLAVEIKELGLGVDIGQIKLSILLFADDIALIADSPEALQTMLNTLSEWCKKWRLSINVEKTKVVHFRPHSVVKIDFNFECLDSTIQVIEQYKYMGLMLNEYIDKGAIAKSVAKSANRALGLLIAKHKAFGGMPHNVFSKLYDSLVVPVIEYAAAVWGNNDFSCINSVQNRACHFFMGVSKFTPNSAVHSDMGWKSTVHKQHLCIARLWHRLSNMDQYRVVSQVFWYSKERAH